MHCPGCGTVRVELKLRFTGYRLRFTVLGYGLKNTFASEVFTLFHRKSLLCCFQSMFLAPKQHLRERPLQIIA